MILAFQLALAGSVAFLPPASLLFGPRLMLAVAVELESLAVAQVVPIRDDNRVHCSGMTVGVYLNNSPSESIAATLVIDGHPPTIHPSLEPGQPGRVYWM